MKKDGSSPWAQLTLAMALVCAKDPAGAVPHFKAALASVAVAAEPSVRYRAACCFEDAVRTRAPSPWPASHLRSHVLAVFGAGPHSGTHGCGPTGLG